ncbi:MAG: acyl-[acyl-carrier-protein]--UDP-N-acetylglucosamine O-acyltransferase, partial [Schleiferiaceae bacterium]|nr:acyl-[acyl-carrier-protein]--UDP-N-acetylglucosamine O-acyltransferase [Schleiferiaceae bacterium]
GGLSAVHQFVHIGEHVMVGGGSMVRQDIPPFITVARTPLAFDGVNSIGLKRRGFSHERIERIQSTYRLLYQSGRNVTQAKEALKDNKDPDSQAILDFIAKSERGILLKS